MEEDRSWTRAGIDAEAYAALARALKPSQLWSLLLDVFAERAQQRSPSSLVQQWERDGFTRPAPIDQRALAALDGHLLAAAADFEALELSPLAPLGVCSAIGLASQKKIIGALRGTEVVSDPTNVLALECARRLRIDATQVVRLATCHRCVRAQALPPDHPEYTPHFRIFCLASAGLERADHAFVAEALAEQIAVHLAGLDRLEQHGYSFPDRRVRVLASAARASTGDRLAALVSAAPVTRELLEHPYYDGLRFLISARNSAGHEVPFIDGGAFDWLAKLSANRRLVLVASGMGAQLAALLFRR